MSGSIVTIRVNGQPYQLGCDKGQEAQIESFGKMVDETVGELVASVGQIGETRLLVMAAILLAEKAQDAGHLSPAPQNGSNEAEKIAADKIAADKIAIGQAERLENLALMISALAASMKPA